MIRTLLLIGIINALSHFSLAQTPEYIPYRKGNLWGVAKLDGTLAIEPAYDFVTFFREGRAAVRKGKKWGFIDTTGNAVLPVEYQQVSPWKNGQSIVVQNELYGLVDTTGHPVVPCQFQRLKYLGNGYYGVKGRYGWGLMSPEGALLTAWKFNFIGQFHEGYFPADYDGSMGFLDTLGEGVTHFIYDEILVNDVGMFEVRVGGNTGQIVPERIRLLNRYHLITPAQGNTYRYFRLFTDSANLYGKGWGYCDAATDTIRIKAQFERAMNFSQERAAVQVGEKWGYIDTTGTIRIAARWQEAYDFSNNLALVRNKNGYGFLSPKGKKFIKPQYGQARPFVEGKALVTTNRQGWGAWMYLDTLGHPVGADDYISGADYHLDRAIVGRLDKNQNKVWGVVDQDGIPVIEIQYQGVFEFNEDLYVVVLKDKIGMMDRDGKLVTPIKFKSLTQVGEQYRFFVHNKKGKIGVVDLHGKKVLNYQYDECKYNAEQDALWVRSGKKYGMINSDGSAIISINYDSIENQFHSGCVIAKIEGKYGLVNVSNQAVTEFIYDAIIPSLPGYFRVVLNGKVGYVSASSGRQYFED